MSQQQLLLLDSTNDLFICGNCKLVFTYLPLFLEHKNLCTTAVGAEESAKPAQKSFIYPDSTKIDQWESSPASLKPTIAGSVTTNVNNLNCNVCKKPFKKLKTLLVHLKTHNGKPYQCTICGRCFNQNSHLQRHEQSHKVWPESLSETTAKAKDVDTSSYSCTYCEKVLTNYNQFRVHLKNHIALKRFKCIQGECVQLFENIEQVLHHVSTDHVVLSYKCHICSELFSSLDNIASHQQNHDKVKKDTQNEVLYKCAQCDAIFKKKENLVHHLSLETHRKTCVHCNKTFASDKRLRLHLQTHQTAKPFQCNVCGQRFLLRKYLASHILKHGDRQFNCAVCNNKFKRKDLLQRHMKLHMARKLFKCPFSDTMGCKREFSRNDKLKLHIKCHTNQLTKQSHKKKGPHKDIAASTMEILIVPLNEDMDI